jgi:hypothetical protein
MRPLPKLLWMLTAVLVAGGVAAFLPLSAQTGMRRALEAAGDCQVP